MTETIEIMIEKRIMVGMRRAMEEMTTILIEMITITVGMIGMTENTTIIPREKEITGNKDTIDLPKIKIMKETYPRKTSTKITEKKGKKESHSTTKIEIIDKIISMVDRKMIDRTNTRRKNKNQGNKIRPVLSFPNGSSQETETSINKKYPKNSPKRHNFKTITLLQNPNKKQVGMPSNLKSLPR